jgi:excisionase family DNA binding protein
MNSPEIPGEVMLTAQAVCGILGMKKSWLYDSVKQGRIAAHRFGRSVRFRKRDVEDFVEQSSTRVTDHDHDIYPSSS